MNAFRRVPIVLWEATASPDDSVLAGRRTPFGWAVLHIGPGRPIRLTGPNWEGERISLRLTVALELWTSGVIRAADSRGRALGSARIDHSDTWEAVDLQLLALEAHQGTQIDLTLSSDIDVFVFVEGDGTPLHAVPHILVPPASAQALPALLDAMESTASMQQFGWKEGCVLDGHVWLEKAYRDGRFRVAARRHVSMYVRGDRLIYEDPWGYPADDSFYGVEAALPIAAIARADPDHPLVDRFLEFVSGSLTEDGLIVDGDQISAEGCYTIAYPLAVIARLRDREDCAKLAMQQLALRIIALEVDDDVFLRLDGGKHTFKNWARAHAWYLLGAVRTLGELPREMWPTDVTSAFIRDADRVVSMQLQSGMWRAFLDDDSTEVDTSGSAGIAASLAAGVRLGLLPSSLTSTAGRCYDTLLTRVTPDGLLSGSTQANKAGEWLQRSAYRVNSQMGSGLLAQLHAELRLAGAIGS